MKKISRPARSRSTVQVASRSQAPSHPFEPAFSGVSLSQKVPQSSSSKRSVR